ncbi:MAG: AAA family ATPase [Candidatus Methanomethylophilaceae archaeon]|nr:AAA family ATPase [Candidatus Methanomethylophilaceae archaeon]
MFDRGSTIIKDASKLTFDYVPVELINRDAEMETLEMIMRPVVDTAASETAFVAGNIGSGKTATVKRFCMDMLDYCGRHNVPFGYILINCRQKTTDASILVQLIRYFDRDFPDKGFSPADMLLVLRKHIVKSGKRMLIVLDEVDSLIKRGSTDLIYQITRFSDDDYNKVSLSLILISQEYVLNKIDKASLSTFKSANTIRFRKYNKEDLVAITASRAKLALVDGTFDDEIIDFIADIAADTGDARVAIDLLDKSARFAENGSAGAIMAEDVRSAKNLMYNLVSASNLRQFGMNKLLVLLAVSRCIKNKTYVSQKAVENTYAVVCEEYETPAKGHTQFWSYIIAMEKEGFIKTFKQFDHAEGAIVKYISLPDIPASTLSRIIERIIEGVDDDEM